MSIYSMQYYNERWQTYIHNTPKRKRRKALLGGDDDAVYSKRDEWKFYNAKMQM